jgi:hypothetical protein
LVLVSSRKMVWLFALYDDGVHVWLVARRENESPMYHFMYAWLVYAFECRDDFHPIYSTSYVQTIQLSLRTNETLRLVFLAVRLFVMFQKVWDSLLSRNNAVECAEESAFPAPPMPGLSSASLPSVVPNEKKTRTYPGTFGDIGAPVSNLINLDVFDGFRFEAVSPVAPMAEVQKGGQPALAITHSLILGSSMLPSGRTYQFGTNYLPSQKEMMLGKLDPGTGSLVVQCVRFPRDSLRFKAGGRLASDSSEESSVVNSDLTYMGKDFSVMGNVGYQGANTGTVGLGFMQSLTSTFAVGASAKYVLSKAEASVSFGGQYLNKDIMMAFKCDSPQSEAGSATFSFLRQVDPKAKLGAELSVTPGARKSSVKLGYEFNLSMTRICGCVDSNFVMMSTVEERIAPGFSLLFSAIMQQSAGRYKFGYGLTFGQ